MALLREKLDRDCRINERGQLCDLHTHASKPFMFGDAEYVLIEIMLNFHLTNVSIMPIDNAVNTTKSYLFFFIELSSHEQYTLTTDLRIFIALRPCLVMKPPICF